MKHERATLQLSYFAKHYLTIAGRIRCEDLDTPIKILDTRFTKKNSVYLRLAHLASAAFRIVNLCEMHNMTRFKYKKKSCDDIKSNLDLYIAHLFRDHIGHTEHAEHPLVDLREPIIKALPPSD